MFARIALLKEQEAECVRILLLPSDRNDNKDLAKWSNYMDTGTYFMITSSCIPLSYADYIVQVWKRWSLQQGDSAQIRSLQQASNRINEIASRLLTKMLKWRRGVAEGSCEAVISGVRTRLTKGADSNAKGDGNHAHMLASWLSGRKLLYNELQSVAKDQAEQPFFHNFKDTLAMSIVQGTITISSSISLIAVQKRQHFYRCMRCYNEKPNLAEFTCLFCGEHCYYCKNCMVMGQSRTCNVLVVGGISSKLVGQEQSLLPPQQVVSLKQYHLSPAQEKVAEAGLHYIYEQLRSLNISSRQSDESNEIASCKSLAWPQLLQARLRSKIDYERNYLIWAVTGAGKTEMIFPLIDYVTAQGGKVLLATPRRDVVLELDPRLRKAFPQLEVVTLYGGSTQRWQQGQLIIATTHQLMRFRHAFELVIIDELDAFPYHGDKSLYQAAKACSYPGGVRVLLSATPPKEMQQALNRGHLAYVRLPVRYHRHPLPVPQLLSTPTVAEQLQQSKIPAVLLTAIKQSLKRDAQVFLFVQRIAQAEPYVALLKRYFLQVPMTHTSSKDEFRTDTVQYFRKRHVRLLVTTTILERGVTIPQSDVYICDADGALFDEASLVQMAGRAGRSSDDPCGKVFFAAKHRNAAQIGAIKQINRMNRLARKQKYLLEQYW